MSYVLHMLVAIYSVKKSVCASVVLRVLLPDEYEKVEQVVKDSLEVAVRMAVHSH